MNVEILKGHRQRVSRVQRPQRLDGNLGSAAVGDAVEVGVDVDCWDAHLKAESGKRSGDVG